jgi:bacillithiol system protein YtxJ
MNWITVTSEEEVQRIYDSTEYSLIYKHSPRCMTSLMAYRQLKSEVSPAPDISVPIYIVDVINNRKESRVIADSFKIEHQSPQLLVVKGGACIYDSSHEDISLKDTLPYLQ